jgi:galactose-1-phosphate uridylyltransferase
MEKIHNAEKVQPLCAEAAKSKKEVSATESKTTTSPNKFNEVEDDENSGNEAEDSQVVMRTEVAIAIKDTA